MTAWEIENAEGGALDMDKEISWRRSELSNIKSGNGNFRGERRRRKRFHGLSLDEWSERE